MTRQPSQTHLQRRRTCPRTYSTRDPQHWQGGMPSQPWREPMRTIPPVPPPRFSLAKPTQPMPGMQPDVTMMILERMQQMQAQNQREFTRLKQQGAADRLAVQQALQALNRAAVAPATGTNAVPKPIERMPPGATSSLPSQGMLPQPGLVLVQDTPSLGNSNLNNLFGNC